MFQTRRILVIVCVAAALLGNLAPALTAQSSSDLVPPAEKGLKAAGPIVTATGYTPVFLSSVVPDSWSVTVAVPGIPVLASGGDGLYAYSQGATQFVAPCSVWPMAVRFEKNYGTFMGDDSGRLFRFHPATRKLQLLATLSGTYISGLDTDPSTGATYFVANDNSQGYLYRLAKGSHTPKLITNLPYLSRGVAVYGNTLYITYWYGVVYRLPKSGGVLEPFLTGFVNPTDVVADAAGNLFITDWGAGSIYKVPKGTAAPEVIASGFINPHGIDVDRYGNVFINEEFSGELWKLEKTR